MTLASFSIKSAVFFGIVAVTCSPLVAASPAYATDGGEVEVSSDGVTYGTTFPGALFGASILIPGSSDTATLWVRNPTATEAYLRVSVSDVTSTDRDYLDALSLRMSLNGSQVATPMGVLDDCSVLINAVPLGAGDAVPVTFVVDLGALDGTRGQGGQADFTVGVSLSDVAYPDADCPPPDVSVPGTPATPADTTTTTPAGGPVDVWAGGQSGAVERGVNKPFRGFLVDFNTGRLDQRFLILLVGTTLGLGAGWLTSLPRNRKRTAALAGTPSAPQDSSHHSHSYHSHSHHTKPGGIR